MSDDLGIPSFLVTNTDGLCRVIAEMSLPVSAKPRSRIGSIAVTLNSDPSAAASSVLFLKSLGAASVADREMTRLERDPIFATTFLKGRVIITSDYSEGVTTGYIDLRLLRRANCYQFVTLLREHLMHHLWHRGKVVIHGGAIVDTVGRCCLVIGPSGTGKSTLIGEAVFRLGFRLVSDDRCVALLDPTRVAGNPAYIFARSGSLDRLPPTLIRTRVQSAFEHRYAVRVPASAQTQSGLVSCIVHVNRGLKPVVTELGSRSERRHRLTTSKCVAGSSSDVKTIVEEFSRVPTIELDWSADHPSASTAETLKEVFQ